MDAKESASGGGEPAPSRQRRAKGHENHIKKHATPSQVRANHEQQQKLTTKVPNGTESSANGASNKKKVGVEGGGGGHRGGTSESPAAGANASRKSQKKLNSDRARVENAGSSLDKNLEICSQRAKEIKAQIGAALEKQAKFHEQSKQSNEVEELRNSILMLTKQQEQQKVESDIANGGGHLDEQQVQSMACDGQQQFATHPIDDCVDLQSSTESGNTGLLPEHTSADNKPATVEIEENGKVGELKVGELLVEPERGALNSGGVGAEPSTPTQETQITLALQGDNNLNLKDDDSETSASMSAPVKSKHVTFKSNKKSKSNSSSMGNETVNSSPVVVQSTAALSSNLSFEPLTARLDPKSKFIALKSSLERHFVACPELLDPICQKFILLTKQIDTLTLYNERNQMEIEKLIAIKSKLSDLCRQLQRSNNQIRIESLDMIKVEQSKAKEQAGKIQSTLSGVMKLFDENQQRNLSLKQENIELQNKLKSILEHCDNWEKCVDTALKQRELENRLIKAEMARLQLVHSEEKEKFFKEKQELLKALTNMKAQQSKIEEKETKLRSDLTSYASKYDECQEIIHQGLSKFQLESKRMLKQIEKSRQDYIQLLGKYEASNKKIKQLLEEKQTWAKSLGAANKKVDTLEKLCRALKAKNDNLLQQQQQQEQSISNQLVHDNKRAGESLIEQGPTVTVASANQETAPASDQMSSS